MVQEANWPPEPAFRLLHTRTSGYRPLPIMTKADLSWVALSMTLLPAVAGAQEPRCLPVLPRHPCFWRTVLPGLEERDKPVSEIRVSGGVPTFLHLPSDVNPRRTAITGGQGRFEPVTVCGRFVIITPLKDLAPNERFSMNVTLGDSTRIPLSLTAPAEGGRTDGHIEVHLDSKSTAALRASLEYERWRADAYLASYRKLLTKHKSQHDAWALIFASGRAEDTKFVQVKTRPFRFAEVQGQMATFINGEDVAVVLTVLNQPDSASWSINEGNVLNPSLPVHLPFGLRAMPDVIPPGGTGTVAFVFDRSAFGPKYDDALDIQVYRDGAIEVSLNVSPHDVTVAQPPKKSWFPPWK